MGPSPFFDSFSSQTGPMFGSGGPPQYMGMYGRGAGQGIPQMGMQLLEPMLQQFMRNQGMVPGQFFPAQNMYDQFLARQHYQGQNKAMQIAADRDRETYASIIQGAGNLFGQKFSVSEAETMAKDFAKVAPIFAQVAPDWFDAFHGSRGSSQLLTQRIHRTGISSVDPVTGRIGMSGESAGNIANEIWAQRYGPGANLAEMKGLGAGRAGMLYEELQNRGYGVTSIGRLNQRDQIRELARMEIDDAMAGRIAESSGKSVADVRASQSELKRMARTGQIDTAALDRMPLDQMLQTFDATRIGGSVKNISGAIAAMNEIFGDNGREGSIPELVAALEQMTQGSMATMSPARLEQTVRRTHALAKNANMSMDVVLGLTAHAGNLGDKLGLDRSLSLPAVQGAMAFGAGVANAGMVNYGGFGSLNREQLTLLDTQLRVQAAASPLANQLGGMMRLYEAGILKPKEGGLADKMIKAVISKNDPDGILFQSQAEFRAAMKAEGLSDSLIEETLRSKHASQEQILNHGIGDIARNFQPREINRMVGQHFANPMYAILRKAGVRGDLRQITERAGVQVVEAALANGNDMNSEEKRTRILADAARTAMRSSLIEQGKSRGLSESEATREADAVIAKIDPKSFAEIAFTGFGKADEEFHAGVGGGYTHFGSAAGYLQTQGDAVLKETRRVLGDSEAGIAMSTEMGGLNMTGPLKRVMNELIQGGKSGTMEDLLTNILGGMKEEKFNEHNPVMRAMLRQGDAARRAKAIGGEKGELMLATAARRTRALAEGGKLAALELLGIQRAAGLSTEESDGGSIESDKLMSYAKSLDRNAKDPETKRRNNAMYDQVVGLLEAHEHKGALQMTMEDKDYRQMMAAQEQIKKEMEQEAKAATGKGGKMVMSGSLKLIGFKEAVLEGATGEHTSDPEAVPV